MALSKVDYNSLNVTAAASKALKWNSTPNGFETGDVGGDLVLIKTLTASSSGTLSFVNGSDDVVLNSTYKEYVFKFMDIHPGTADSTQWTFNLSADTGSNYNVTKTTTFVQCYNNEDDTATSVGYNTSGDLAQATGFAQMFRSINNNNDDNLAGYLYLYDPSNTTFVKHFVGSTQGSNAAPASYQGIFAGYGNTTSAVDAVQFKMNTGNIDAGTIKMYGVK